MPSDPPYAWALRRAGDKGGRKGRSATRPPQPAPFSGDASLGALSRGEREVNGRRISRELLLALALGAHQALGEFRKQCVRRCVQEFAINCTSRQIGSGTKCS